MERNPGPGHEEGPAPGLADAAEAIRHGAKRTKLRRGALVSLFTVAGLTLAAELVLRIGGHRQRYFEATVNRTIQPWVDLTTGGIFEELDDPVRRYAMRPGAEVEVGAWTFRVSSHRTRGADFPREKPAGEKRLLCLGDSFAFGLWCDEDQTLAGHLARLANAREDELGSGAAWRAVDLGVPGYHAGQQLRAFEQDGLALDPDVVVLYFNSNDIEEEGFFFDDDLGVLRRDFLPLPTGLRRMLWNSHLYGWIVLRHRRSVEAGPTPPHMDPEVPYAFVREDNQAATRDAIARIAELCRERDVPLFFVNQPHLTWQGELQAPDWPMLPLVAWAEELRAELGLPGVSLLGLFRGYSDGVDRSAEGAPPDFLLDVFCADAAVQEAVAWARESVGAQGRVWDDLTLPERLTVFGRYPGEMPATPDFHLTGEGYGHLARVTYAAMRAAEVLP
jgi:hypothetical protein